MKDRKVQMMDAGTALFTMDEEFGTALGQVRAELKEFGKVEDEDDEMILDFSTPWRKRFISCRLEDAGGSSPHRYAAVFKEGNRSTALRAVTHMAAAAAVLVLTVFTDIKLDNLSETFLTIIGIILCFAIIYAWITPSARSVRTLRKIEKKISDLA